MADAIPVTFLPTGITALVAPGTTVAAAASAAGVSISTPCGTRGICGECGVRVVFGELAEPDETESQTLRRAPSGVRLACRAVVVGPVGVRPLVAHKPVTSASAAERSNGRVVAGVDLGTTNVSARLVDSERGVEIATATVPNGQDRFGSDVLSRLSAALDGHADELRILAERSVVEALRLAADAAGLESGRVERVAIAGNTAMASLLLGLDVSGLATHPFEPPYSTPATLSPSAEVVVAVPALKDAVVVPPVAGFVGGDAVAASLATGLLSARAADSASLMVDVGTNAEIVLRSGARLIVASAAAGPAFEGWGVSSGGRAGEGAVERVVVRDEVPALETPSGEQPDRFSGAGLVSALAALRSLGWIGADGRIASHRVPADHLTVDDAGVTSVILGLGQRRLSLSQLDIRTLQLAKAAIRTGVDRVLAEAAEARVGELLLAGAFGHALRPEDGAAIGLFPERLVPVTRSVGNAALTGATMIALAPASLDEALGQVAMPRHLDLAGDAAFQTDLLGALQLEP